jgi:copper oxidase (laccase) domain-containing protein
VGFIKNRLVQAGVVEEKIRDSVLCTACALDRFFSARREGPETGRFLSAVVLK